MFDPNVNARHLLYDDATGKLAEFRTNRLPAERHGRWLPAPERQMHGGCQRASEEAPVTEQRLRDAIRECGGLTCTFTAQCGNHNCHKRGDEDDQDSKIHTSSRAVFQPCVRGTRLRDRDNRRLAAGEDSGSSKTPGPSAMAVN